MGSSDLPVISSGSGCGGGVLPRPYPHRPQSFSGREGTAEGERFHAPVQQGVEVGVVVNPEKYSYDGLMGLADGQGGHDHRSPGERRGRARRRTLRRGRCVREREKD
jgi:hypothetical protein